MERSAAVQEEIGVVGPEHEPQWAGVGAEGPSGRYRQVPAQNYEIRGAGGHVGRVQRCSGASASDGPHHHHCRKKHRGTVGGEPHAVHHHVGHQRVTEGEGESCCCGDELGPDVSDGGAGDQAPDPAHHERPKPVYSVFGPAQLGKRAVQHAGRVERPFKVSQHVNYKQAGE